jgi:Tfp pilus assembly protein PilF
MPLSKQAAQRALELDNGLAEGHASLGLVHAAFEWQWDLAEREFRRAMDLHPGLAWANPLYAFCCLLPQRRFDEALQLVQRGLSLDPFNPLFHSMATFMYICAGRLNEALRQHSFAVEVGPQLPAVLAAGGLAHQHAGRMNQALELYSESAKAAPPGTPHTMANLAHGLATAGDFSGARRMLNELLEQPRPAPTSIAIAYAGLKEPEDALKWLERAAAERSLQLLVVPPDPRFAELRGHPRFQAILEQMGLGAAASRG